MICRACREKHKEKPEGCPDCGCQHKGELPKPVARREPILIGWECRKCGVLVKDYEEPCACAEPWTGDLRELYDTDL